ncbi:MAG: hypothetical protein R6W68_09145 [Ignavibacteriaceae bacterium]
MKKNILIKLIFIILLIFTSAIYFGCEQKTDEKEVITDKDSVETNTSTANEATSNETNPDPAVEPEFKIPDIAGQWSGTLDKRSTTLEITEQTDSSFSGKITISYRNPVHQQVKGLINLTNLNVTMADQIQSRYMGTYDGKLSEDFKNFTGTFTMKNDNTKYSFNLNKK